MIGSWQVSARQTSSLALDPGAGLYHTCTDDYYSLYTRLSRDCFYKNLEVQNLQSDVGGSHLNKDSSFVGALSVEGGDTVPQGVGTSLYGDLAFLLSAPYHAVHLLFRVRCKGGHFINLFIC